MGIKQYCWGESHFTPQVLIFVSHVTTNLLRKVNVHIINVEKIIPRVKVP